MYNRKVAYCAVSGSFDSTDRDSYRNNCTSVTIQYHLLRRCTNLFLHLDTIYC